PDLLGGICTPSKMDLPTSYPYPSYPPQPPQQRLRPPKSRPHRAPPHPHPQPPQAQGCQVVAKPHLYPHAEAQPRAQAHLVVVPEPHADVSCDPPALQVLAHFAAVPTLWSPFL
ncbi:hypothetical protein A2U01_0056430, partial [Trifolium medium]|nr:hypothetical protein [Trifolium medium]